MDKNTEKENILKLRPLSSAIVIIVCVILTILNLLILYFFPGNIFSDLAFVFVIFFLIKVNGWSGIYIFFYSILYLLAGAVLSLLNNPVLTSKWSLSISFYIMALFILAFLNYIYEKKLEIKIKDYKRKKIYSLLSVLFFSLFLIFTVFFNMTDTKVYFFNRFHTEKYFNEIEVLEVGGEDIRNAVNFSIEAPGQYSVIDGFFAIEGWAIDESDIAGTNIDYVGVYLDGKPKEGGKFISRGEYENKGRSVDKIRGNKYDNSEFNCYIDSRKIEDGLRKFYVAFHSNNFGWKYGELELFIHNNETFIFKDIFDKEVDVIKLQNASFTRSDGDIVIEEGDNVLKYIEFPLIIESGYQYLINFEIKSLSGLDNNIYFDFYGNSYDNYEQEFVIEPGSIFEEYKEIIRIINSGDVPPGEDTYFRIYTNSGGSLKIKNLTINKIYKK